MYRFCLFVTVGNAGRNQYKFYQTEPSQTGDFKVITMDDIEVINPNTKTCPSFRTIRDFEFARKIYKRCGVLQNESNPEKNTWNVRIKTPFHMANDSWLFKTYSENLLPLYEAKYIYHFNHRYCIWRNDNTVSITLSELSNPAFITNTQYYLTNDELNERYGNSNWYLVYRMITNATNERTMVSTLLPGYPCGNSLSIIETDGLNSAIFLEGCLNSFVFDFFARQTVGGSNFNHWILKQLPVIDYNKANHRVKAIIHAKVFHLTYTAIDLKPLAEEYGYHGEPFLWNDKERFQLQCELDAIYAHLYGLEREEMDYILETFPIVKRKDIAKCGSYRTKETILQMYDEFAWVRDEINQHQTTKTEQT
jgi:hypothetical protein